MATSLSRGIEDLVMCPICYEQFEDPRVLPCLHTYCKRCLERLLAGKTTISCPECRKTIEINDVNQLKVNFQINNLTSLLKDTEKVTQRPSFCETHQEALKLFCETCDQLICCECIVVDHKSHQFGYLEEIAKTRKEHLTEVIKSCIANADIAKTVLDKMLMPDKVTPKQDIYITEEKEVVLNDLVITLTIVESAIEFTKRKVTRCSDIEIVLLHTQVMPQLFEMLKFILTQLEDMHEEPASTEISREPIDLEVLSAHEKIFAVHPRTTSMVQEGEVERNSERANIATLKQMEQIGPEVQSPHENMMKELHSVSKDTQSRNPGKRRAPRPPLPIPMAKGKGLEGRKEDVRRFSTSFPEVAKQRQGVDISPHENMMNELHSVSKDTQSRSQGKRRAPRPPPPMAKEKGLERRNQDRLRRPYSTSFAEVAMERQAVDSKVINPHEMMMKELNTAINKSGSRNPTGDQRPTSPMAMMARKTGEEKRVDDEMSSSSIPATDVACTLRQRFERNLNLR